MMRRVLAAGLTLVALAAPGCEREPETLRGALHEMIDEIEALARDEIELIEDLIAQPGGPRLAPEWRNRLDDAIAAVEGLADLRADIDASTDIELVDAVGPRVVDFVDEMRRAMDERMRDLRSEIGGPQTA